jgi:hypothetical protein
MRTDKFNAALGQALAKWIAISGPVVDQPVGDVRRDHLVEQRLDKGSLIRLPKLSKRR